MHNTHTVNQTLKIVEEYYQERYDQVLNLRDMLRSLEWLRVTPRSEPMCPICRSIKRYGHAKMCRLALLLTDERE